MIRSGAWDRYAWALPVPAVWVPMLPPIWSGPASAGWWLPTSIDVAPSNLNRQFYFIDQVGMKKVIALEANLKRINPDLDVQALDIR